MIGGRPERDGGIEGRLRRTEALLRAFFYDSGDARAVLEAIRDTQACVRDWRFADANDAALRVVGLTREAFVGARASELYPELAKALHPRWLAVLETGAPATYEQPWNDRFFRVSLVRIDRDSLSSSAVDVTEARRAEHAVRESEERFRTMADNIPQLAWMAEPSGFIFWYNRRWYEYTGTDYETMKGWGWAKVHHPDHLDSVVAKWKEGLASATGWEDTFPLRGKDGAYRWFLSRALPIKDAAGQVLRWFGTNTDVTEQREAARSIVEADRRKSEFIGMLSHELRNPLAAIRNSLAILSRAGAGEAQAARAREVIERQVVHLARLVDDLLDVQRISSGKIELRRHDIDLREVVRRACEDHRSLFEERGVDLRCETLAGAVSVEADATRIAQVVGNLLENAASFSSAGGQTTVTVGRTGQQAELRVRDTGIGIDPSQVERMFEPFAQAENTLARTRGGLGLGLALVKGLVELHGGTVQGSSEGPDRGAEFVVHLPLSAPVTAPPPAQREPPRASPRKVLVVEDNVDAGETLRDLLELTGHSVWLASDGRTAVALAAQHRPDVIICDVGLPDISGYEVAKILRSDASMGAIRLVALTGYAQPEDKERARQAGFDAHLAKPPSIEALDAAIAEGSAA